MDAPSVVSLSERRELQVWFDRCVRMAANPPYDAGVVDQLLSECVRRDPGNSIYVQAYLQNLEMRRQSSPARRSWFAGRRLAKACQRGDWRRAFASGLEILRRHPHDAEAIHRMGQATWHWELEEAAQCYLFHAATMAPDDRSIKHTLGEVLVATGQFSAARSLWRTLDGETAQRFLSDLTPQAGESETDDFDVGTATDAVGREDDAVSQLRSTAVDCARSADFEAALEHCQHALQLSPGNQQTYELLQQIRIRQGRADVATADRLVASGLADPQLSPRMRQNLNRLELEVFSNRHQREPGDRRIAMELGRRLAAAGNFDEVQRMLELAASFSEIEPECRLKIGECLQHRHQFEDAAAQYEWVIRHPDSPEEVRRLATYRLAILDLAMGNLEKARRLFERLPAGFRQTRHHLDKIERMRHKGEFPSGDRAPE